MVDLFLGQRRLVGEETLRTEVLICLGVVGVVEKR
jgi:hypothetical protein